MSFQQPKEGNGSHNPTPAPTDVQTQPQSTPTQYPSPFSPTGNVLDTYSELPAGEQPILGVPSAYSYPFFVSPQDSSPNAVPVDGGHPSGPLGAVEAARTPPKRTAEAPVRPFSRQVLTEWNDESGPTRVRASRHRHHQDSPRNDSDSPRSASGDDEDHRKKALGFAPMEPHPPPPVSNRSSRPMSLQCSGEGFVQRRRSMMMDHLVYDDEEYVADEPDALRRESLEHQRHRALLSEDPSEDDVADLSTHLDEKHHAKTRRDTTVVYDREGNPDMVDGLTFFRQLGSGASGTVWHCLDTTADQERAVKAIPRNKCGRSRLAALPEVAVMKSLHHHHIVRLYECIDDPKHPTVYLVMQFVNGGAVSTMASDGTCAPIDLKDLAHVLQGVTSALIHCHRLGIVHGDVKPDNILVERHGGKVHSYLADFGVSMACYKKPVDACDSVCHGTVEDFLRAVGELSDGGGDTLSNDSSSRAATFGLRGPGALGGTPAFLAPEVLCGQERTPASDMWALGVTIYALIFGHLPFPVTPECTLATLKKLVCEGDPMFPPEATTSPMLRRWKMVIKQLMQKDPALRLTAVALSRCKLLYPHTYAAMTFASSNDFDDHHNPLSTAPSIISELSTSASILSGSNLSSFIAGVDMASSSSSRQQLLSSLRAQSLRATNE